MPDFKICFVSPQAYVYFNRSVLSTTGGAERQIYLLGKELALLPDLDVNVIVADFGQKDFETIDNVKLWKTFSFKESKIQGFLKLIKTIKKIDAGVYIFRSINFGNAIVLLTTKLFYNKKVVYMVASDVETDFERMADFIGWFTARFMLWSYKAANALTFQSRFQELSFKTNYNIRKSMIVPNLSSGEDAPVSQARKSILWVGRCERLKRPEIFIDLAVKYPNEQFIMICPPAADKEYWNQVKKSAQELTNLVFIDFISPQKVSAFYLYSKIFVMTSEFEGFSNTMLESMTCGCPIISLSVNPDEIIDQFSMGFYCHNNLGLFYHNFDLLLKNEFMQYQYGGNAIDYIKNNHHPVTIASKFYNFIKTV